MLEEVIEARISELKTMFFASNVLNHRGEKGALREAFVMNLIQQFLPQHFGLGSGIIIDKFGGQSVQVDIVIYDKRIAPPVIEAAGRGVYLMDSVLRVIEVKSRLNSAALGQFAKMVQCLTPDSPGSLRIASPGKLKGNTCYYPACAMFGFQSDIKDLGKSCSSNETIFNSHTLIYAGIGEMWVPRETNLFNHDEPYNGRHRKFDNENYGLRLFIGLILNLIEETAQSRSSYRPLDWLLPA